MAIKGDGYFSVAQPLGIGSDGQPTFSESSPVYTRRGDFQVDSNGYLVNGAGNYLMGNPIDASTGSATTGAPQILQVNSATLPTDQGALQSLSVGSNGDLQGTFASGKTIGLAGIPLTTFRGEQFLQQSDGGTFTPTAQSGAAQLGASGQVVGNSLEASNANVSDQFTAIIMTQQAYSANTKVMTTTNEMLQDLTNLSL